MNRRTAIRNVVIISAGAGLLPSCIGKGTEPSFSPKNFPLTGSQEEMLAELSETIIPKTPALIGAKDLKAHEFVLTMVDDCRPPEEQAQFSKGMREFDEACKKKMGKPFIDCNPMQRKEWLQVVGQKKDVSSDAIKFYEITRDYTVQDFLTSKDYLTGIRHYKMVPGPNYKGCVPVK